MDRQYLYDILQDELSKGVEQIREAIKANSRYSTGATGRSLKVYMQKMDNRMSGRILTDKAWFPAIENGRGPWRGGNRGGFSEAMKRWARGAGLRFENEKALERWVSFYCWKVNKEGNSLYKSRQQRQIYTPIILQIIDNIKKRLNLGDYGLQFGNILRKHSFDKKLNLKL